jgi:uncharacterized protein
MQFQEPNYRVTSVAPSEIEIEILDPAGFKGDSHPRLVIGSYLRISDDDGLSIIAVVKSYRLKAFDSEQPDAIPRPPSFVLQAQPVGSLDDEKKFKRGGQQIAIPPTHVEVAGDEVLRAIYNPDDPLRQYSFGNLVQDSSITVMIDGNRFFGKHIAVIGATGSGKSCTVAKILQEATKQTDDQNRRSVLNNSHIVLFDLHGEYAPAFPNANRISVASLSLPYWLMNSEELEEMFIETGERNSYNQVSQFKRAVTINKQRHNPGIAEITYDSPVYFSIQEVFRYIKNQNSATKDAETSALKIKNAANLEGVPEKFWLFEEIEFEEKVRGKVNDGPYYGEFHGFVSRLETKLADERLAFLLKPRKTDGTEYCTDDLELVLRQLLGYKSLNETNVTVVDLSAIPFEVLSIVVALATRLIFDFALYFKRIKGAGEEVPILLVYEEAHRYVPNDQGARFSSVRRAIERVAKEGRKYGLSLMIVSQRPSEISETIFSQCNSFVAMRLTNPADQSYVRRLLPDELAGITDALPSLEQRECILLGDAGYIPTLVRVGDVENTPDSADIKVHKEWAKDWYAAQFEKIVANMAKAAPGAPKTQ